MSGCVKIHVCMKNKTYIPSKSKDEVGNSQKLWFSYSLSWEFTSPQSGFGRM